MDGVSRVADVRVQNGFGPEHIYDIYIEMNCTPIGDDGRCGD